VYQARKRRMSPWISNCQCRSVAQLGLLVQESDDPFTSFRREIDRLFEDFNRGWAAPTTFGTSEFLSPKVNIAETDKGLEVTADLPGIDQKDIEISLSDDVLTLKAEHKAEKEEKDEKKQYHLV